MLTEAIKVKATIEPSQAALSLIDTIQHKATNLRRCGLEPKRVYMSLKTKLLLIGGVFNRNMVTVVPHGRERRDTVLGLDICECNSLPDGFIDVGADDQY